LRKRRKEYYKLLLELHSQVVNSSNRAEGGGKGKLDTNYRDQAVRKGVRAPNILHMIWFLAGPSLLRGPKNFFTGLRTRCRPPWLADT